MSKVLKEVLERAISLPGGGTPQAEGEASAEPLMEEQQEASRAVAAAGMNAEKAKMWSEDLEADCAGQ